MDLRSAIAALLLTKLHEQVQAGFPNLTRIPSGGIIKFLDYFASLPAAERGYLLEVMARLRFLTQLMEQIAGLPNDYA